MNHSDATASSKPLTGRRIAVYIGAGFAVILTANLTLAVFAVRSWSGLLARNGYVASQNYNQVLARAREQAARGWKARLRLAQGVLRLEVSDASGAPVTGLQLRVRLGRPVHENDDFEVPMVAAQGGYRATAQLAPGVWYAQVFSVGGRAAYKRNFRLRIAVPGD